MATWRKEWLNQLGIPEEEKVVDPIVEANRRRIKKKKAAAGFIDHSNAFLRRYDKNFANPEFIRAQHEKYSKIIIPGVKLDVKPLANSAFGRTLATFDPKKIDALDKEV